VLPLRSRSNNKAAGYSTKNRIVPVLVQLAQFTTIKPTLAYADFVVI